MDEGEGEKRIEEQDFLGQAETTLAQIFTQSNQTIVLVIRDLITILYCIIKI